MDQITIYAFALLFTLSVAYGMQCSKAARRKAAEETEKRLRRDRAGYGK
jgi:hypothetical protein